MIDLNTEIVASPYCNRRIKANICQFWTKPKTNHMQLVITKLFSRNSYPMLSNKIQNVDKRQNTKCTIIPSLT